MLQVAKLLGIAIAPTVMPAMRSLPKVELVWLGTQVKTGSRRFK